MIKWIQVCKTSRARLHFKVFSTPCSNLCPGRTQETFLLRFGNSSRDISLECSWDNDLVCWTMGYVSVLEPSLHCSFISGIDILLYENGSRAFIIFSTWDSRIQRFPWLAWEIPWPDQSLCSIDQEILSLTRKKNPLWVGCYRAFLD